MLSHNCEIQFGRSSTHTSRNGAGGNQSLRTILPPAFEPSEEPGNILARVELQHRVGVRLVGDHDVQVSNPVLDTQSRVLVGLAVEILRL